MQMLVFIPQMIAASDWLEKHFCLLFQWLRGKKTQGQQGSISCKDGAEHTCCPTISHLFLVINLGDCKMKFFM
jgi:hypothetical protein